jgi:hypothetical protein
LKDEPTLFEEAPVNKPVLSLLPVLLASLCLALLPLAGCGEDETPGSHTVDLGGADHAPGFADPLANCARCHGSDLRGGEGPNCYRCHDNADHAIVRGNGIRHRQGATESCAACHGPGNSGGLGPACATCHG